MAFFVLFVVRGARRRARADGWLPAAVVD